jgi:hypothetical protein
MKKIIVVSLVLLVLSIVGYFFYNYSKKTNSTDLTETSLVAPGRPADITGLIVSQLGNEVVVAKEIGKVILSEEEQAIKKAESQKLTPEERSALKAQESANLTTEDIKLIIPVGTTIAKGAGDASGKQIIADIAELTKGTYISVWLDQNNNIEYVKIKQI